MIRVSVMYPNSESVRFDHDYYMSRHMPDAARLIGSACLKAEVDQGLAGGAPGQAAPYVVMAHLFFESVESFQTAFGPVAAQIMADLPNFTNATPVIQISQVRL
jgi:uncharacterized protein (TIGR02118 family)